MGVVMVEDLDELLRLVEGAYLCALQPSHLPRFLEALNAYVGAEGAHIVLATRHGWEVRAVSEGAVGLEAGFQRKWGIQPASVLDIRQMTARRVFSFSDFPTLFEQHLESPVTSAGDWSSGLAGVVGAEDGSALLVIVFQVNEGATGVDTLRARLERVLPHLTRAFTFMRNAEEHVLPLTGVAALLRRFPVACLLTDAVGRCIDQNDAFDKILPEVQMEITSGRVRFDDPYLQSSWQSALFETAETAVHHSILASAPQGKQWKAHLVPIHCLAGDPELQSTHLILVVFEEQGASRAPLPESFASVGKLTPAEIEVLSGLLQGYTAKVIAKARGASVNTVRSQIMAILGKTGHRSQKELIAAFGASSFDASSLGPQDD
jgi:DNA-binding CsgD family transcriptional regulator